MGLEEFRQEADPALKYKKYSYPDLDNKLERIAEELQELFPERVKYDFIEASPALSKHDGMAYYKVRNGQMIMYIRIEVGLAQNGGHKLRSMLLHELTHIYFYQKGYTNLSDGDPMFHWVLGALGAHLKGVNFESKMWKELAEPLIDGNNGLKPEQHE